MREEMREVVAKEVAALREEVSSCKTLIRERFDLILKWIY